jgi:LacI family transcriptional regulator
VVFIDNYSRGSYSNFSYVNSDDETGGYLATKQLIGKGYERIALCAVELSGPLMQKRYEGYRRALKEAGCKEYVFDKLGTPFEAGEQFADVLAAQKINAAFCTEDMVAVGVLHGMQRKGVRVGQEFGLVGFDNIHIGRQVFPELTTIDQNIFEKGETATKTLLKILNKKSSLGSRLILPVHLVARETA